MMMDCSGRFFVNRKVTKIVTNTAGIRRLARRSGTTSDAALRLLPFKSKAQANRAIRKYEVTKARLAAKWKTKNRCGLLAKLLKRQQQLLQQDSARAGRNVLLWPILLGNNNSDPIPNSPLFPRNLLLQAACTEASSTTTTTTRGTATPGARVDVDAAQYSPVRLIGGSSTTTEIAMITTTTSITRGHTTTTTTDIMGDKGGGLVSDLCSPSSLATRLGLIPTPQREAYISLLLSNAKCSGKFYKVIEPAQCSLNFAVTPSTLPEFTPKLFVALFVYCFSTMVVRVLQKFTLLNDIRFHNVRVWTITPI